MAGMHFYNLCRALELMHTKKDKGHKLVVLQKLLNSIPGSNEYFSVLRLLIPQRDRLRPPYNMQTKVIGQVIDEALGLAAESTDVKKLVEWRSGGEEMGANAGNFALSCTEVLINRQRQTPSGVTCDQINDYLDRLAATTFKRDRVAIFRELIGETTTLELKWLIAILLKEVRVGLGEDTVLKTFHPDADAFYKTKCDLRALCKEPKDRKTPWIRTGIEMGTAFDPQHLKRGITVDEALKQMRGKSIVVEHKFDGDRMLLHKDGDTVTFISRQAKKHPEYFDFGEILKKHLPPRCILDGELLTWDVERSAFAQRTKASNKNAGNAQEWSVRDC